jgi:hypothetical protein
LCRLLLGPDVDPACFRRDALSRDGGAVVIALEKLLAKGEWVAKATGVAAIVVGLATAGVAIRAL